MPDVNLRPYDGVIEYGDIDDFLESSYDLVDGWEMIDQGKLHGLSSGRSNEGYTQYSDSVYKTLISGAYYGEGNCGLTSTSNALQYYSRHGGFYDLPNYDDMVLITPSVDEPNYMATVASLSQPYYPKDTSVSIHEIYSAERDYAIAQGYVCRGMNDTQTSAAFVGAASDYGYLGEFTAYSSFTFQTIKNEIDANRPLQLRTNEDLCYGGHGMMITGYREYYAEDRVQVGPSLSIYAEYHLPFVSVFDGRSVNERWFDLTSISNLGANYSRSTSQTIATLHLSEAQ